MSFANHYGYKKTSPFCFGVAVGFFFLLLACHLFNHLLISILPVIELPLTILGVGYMLYLAYKTIFSKDTNLEEKQNSKNLFYLGLLTQFINPKGVLFSITLVTAFILPNYHSFFAYFIISILIGGVGFMSSSSWSLFGSIFQKYLSKYRKVFNILMALLLVYSAYTIAFS